MGGVGLAARAGVGAVVMKQVKRRGQGPGRVEAGQGRVKWKTTGLSESYSSVPARGQLNFDGCGGGNPSYPTWSAFLELEVWGCGEQMAVVPGNSSHLLSIQYLPGLSFAQVFSHVS